jgi:hypothetical protein
VIEFTPIASNTVFVAKPFEMSYADAMQRCLRTWLDHEKIQPAGFKISSEATETRIGFEITFSTEQEALAFGRFKWFRATP